MNRLGDVKVHAEQWQEVLKWPFEFATSHHDPVTVCGPLDMPEVMDGEGGVKGHIQRKLDQSGEVSSWFSDAFAGR